MPRPTDATASRFEQQRSTKRSCHWYSATRRRYSATRRSSELKLSSRASVLAFAKRNWFSFLVLIVVLVLGNLMEEHTTEFPWLIRWQLRWAALLSKLDMRAPVVERVTVVEIDDNTFWKRLAGVLPTDRKFLAQLVRNGSGANGGPKAALIAIDIKLVSPYDKPEDDRSRRSANTDLLQAVKEAGDRGVPTVLTDSLVEHATKREPNIFDDSQWAAGTRFGYINLPGDKRMIPLETDVENWDGKDARWSSFGLVTALTYNRVRHMAPVTESNPVLRRAIAADEFVEGGFLKAGDFPHVSAAAIADAKPKEAALIDQRIMMIGSTWHQSAYNRGAPADAFLTPAGEMPGIYVHANYVEAMLDGRIRLPVSRTAATMWDLILGLFVIVLLDRISSVPNLLIVCAVCVLPLRASYVFFINLGLYLDFVLPLILLFIHPLMERMWKGEDSEHAV